MKVNFFIVIFIIISVLGCTSDNTQEGITGQYSGTFQRGENTSEVTLILNESDFSGESESVKFPAICNGNYSIANNTITFENQCVWTADFDWNLILNNEWSFNYENNSLTLTNSIGDIYTLNKQ